MVGLQGQILTRMLPNIIQSEGYQSAPDVFKTQIIRQATEKVREATSKPFAAIAEMRSLGIEHDLRPDEMVLIDEMISHDIYGSIADDATKKKTMLRVVGQIRSSR